MSSRASSPRSNVWARSKAITVIWTAFSRAGRSGSRQQPKEFSPARVGVFCRRAFSSSPVRDFVKSPSPSRPLKSFTRFASASSPAVEIPKVALSSTVTPQFSECRALTWAPTRKTNTGGFSSSSATWCAENEEVVPRSTPTRLPLRLMASWTNFSTPFPRVGAVAFASTSSWTDRFSTRSACPGRSP